MWGHREGPIVAVALALVTATVPAALAASASQPVESTASAWDGPPPDCGDRTPHPPVRITQDAGPQGFVLGHTPDGEPIHRPGSGVVAGTGTPEDPYVIEDWCIQPDNPTGAGITIQNTTAHVLVQNNLLDGNERGERGIQLTHADHVTIADNTITDHRLHGLQAQQADDLTVRENRIEANGGGVRLTDADGARVQANTIHANNEPGLRDNPYYRFVHDRLLDRDRPPNRWDGIAVDRSAQVHVLGNTITDHNRSGIEAHEAPDITAERNTLAGNDVFIIDTDGAHLADNTVGETVGASVDLRTSSQARLTDNTLSRGLLVFGDDPRHYNHDVDTSNLANGEPIRYVNAEDSATVREPAGQVIVANAEDVTVEDVDLTGTRVGLWAAFADDLTVQNTTAADNRIGAVVYGSDRAHLVDNSISGNGYGYEIVDTSQARLTDQTVTGNEYDGIHLHEAPGTEITGSTIADNGYDGLSVTDTSGTVDARDNWWGDASGPSGDVEDACTGTPADGTGAQIRTHNASVCFDPWLTDPNPDAGVG